MKEPQSNGEHRKVPPLLSSDDPDLHKIVEKFVCGLSGRIDELNRAHEALDWSQLQLLAHRLKGASGAFGYPDLSKLSATMEDGFRSYAVDEFAGWIQALNELAVAAREALNQPPSGE